MSQPQFHTEPAPPRATLLPCAPGISRIVAANPGPMTYHGTNTYLLHGPDGITVVDPGPDDAAHIAAIRAAGPIARIVLTHTHTDHIEALPTLRGDLPVHAFAQPQADIGAFTPIADGDTIAGWTAIHTPGHAADHLCFAREDGVVLSGDHIMGWSSTVVSPPHGNMLAYFASLDRMLAHGGHTYLPGHGPAIPNPADYTSALRAHRLARESAILAALDTPRTISELTQAIYLGLAPHLRPAAERNVLAHLEKLATEARAEESEGKWKKGKRLLF
jgi:glyoxylase-like metal-dependent hydrolase (beta-lactamase superfamily II)